jgi:hypothetical protein
MKNFILPSITFITLLILNACSSTSEENAINEVIDLDTYLINISEASLNFGDISTGSTNSKNFTINNIGTGSISISGFTSTSNFIVMPSSATIITGGSKIFSITFSPDTTENYEQSISVTSNATNGPGTLNLNGYGIDPFYFSTIAPIIMQNCSTSGCHSATSKASGFAMTNFLEIKGVFIGDDAWGEITAGRMPKGRSLTQTQKDDLMKWIDSDYTDGSATLAVTSLHNIAQ